MKEAQRVFPPEKMFLGSRKLHSFTNIMSYFNLCDLTSVTTRGILFSKLLLFIKSQAADEIEESKECDRPLGLKSSFYCAGPREPASSLCGTSSLTCGKGTKQFPFGLGDEQMLCLQCQGCKVYNQQGETKVPLRSPLQEKSTTRPQQTQTLQHRYCATTKKNGAHHVLGMKKYVTICGWFCKGER